MSEAASHDVEHRPVDAGRYSIGWGRVLFRPIQEPDPKMSRRRRRRLRGKRKAGLLPPWGFRPLGDVSEFKMSFSFDTARS